MAETPNGTGPTQLGTTATAVYTAPAQASTWAIVRAIWVTNTDTVARNVTLGKFTSASDTAARRIVDETTVNPDETIVFNEFLVLDGSATTPELLYGFCDAASVVNVTVNVVEGP